mmetsp:Transcript_59391/g.193801  ORF Transcript_59391/g.193801 Transcript_59391/m.193801 type:complete len:341 (-) Transcript_59391:849-1871(-)
MRLLSLLLVQRQGTLNRVCRNLVVRLEERVGCGCRDHGRHADDAAGLQEAVALVAVCEGSASCILVAQRLALEHSVEAVLVLDQDRPLGLNRTLSELVLGSGNLRASRGHAHGRLRSGRLRSVLLRSGRLPHGRQRSLISAGGLRARRPLAGRLVRQAPPFVGVDRRAASDVPLILEGLQATRRRNPFLGSAAGDARLVVSLKERIVRSVRDDLRAARDATGLEEAVAGAGVVREGLAAGVRVAQALALGHGIGAVFEVATAGPLIQDGALGGRIDAGRGCGRGRGRGRGRPGGCGGDGGRQARAQWGPLPVRFVGRSTHPNECPRQACGSAAGIAALGC